MFDNFDPSCPFNLAEMQDIRRMYVLKAARLGLGWARVHMYRETPEGRNWLQDLPFDLQDGYGDEQEERHHSYREAMGMIRKIDRYMAQRECKPDTGMVDTILSNIDHIVVELGNGNCLRETFTQALDSDAATLAALYT